MRYNTSKLTGLKVSSIGLGTHYTVGDRCDLSASRQLVQQALDSGINLIDTSNNYAAGKTEQYLGQVLSDTHRSQYILATKVYFPVFAGPNGCGLTRKHLFESTHQSLQRMGVDYIDVLQLHRFDAETPLNETLEALKLLQTQGKILYWAVSNWNLTNLQEAIALGMTPLWNQIPLNYFHTANLSLCKQQNELGIDSVLYGCLAQGVISDRYLRHSQLSSSRIYHPDACQHLYHNNPTDLNTLQKIDSACKRAGISLTSFAIAYVESQTNPLSILAGSYRREHFDNFKTYLAHRDEIIERVSGIIEEINHG